MHRLRDLDRRQATWAVVVALALAAPFVASVVRAVDAGWRPSNDDALIALRVRDVLDGHLPKVGQPSTADLYAGTDPPHHPGPIEFYAFAPVVGLFGSSLGMLLGPALVNLASVLVAVWVVLRRAGPGPAAGAALAFGALAFAQGPALLSDPVSSNMGGIPLLALAVLAWAVVDGDVRLLPLAALWFAWVFQQHLAVVGLATGTAAWAGVGVIVAVVGWRRYSHLDRAAAGADPDGGTSGGTARRGGDREAGGGAEVVPVPPWPWIGAAVATSLVAWAPVLWDQAFGTGNLGRMLRFARSSDRPSLGLASGLRQAARALGVPPLLARTNLTGDDLTAPLSILAVAGAAAVVVALVAVAARDRGRNRRRALLAVTALVLAVLGAVTGSNVPDSVEAARLNFYRWTFVVCALTWLTLAWAAASWAGAWAARRTGSLPAHRPGGAGRWGPVLVAGVVLVAVLAVAVSGPRTRRDEQIFGDEDRIADATLEALGPPGDRPVLLVPAGRSAGQALAPALALELEEAGHDVAVPPRWRAGYGEHFVATGGPGGLDGAVVVASGRGAVEPGPGRVVLRIDLNAATADARAAVADALRGRRLVRSERADAVLEQVVGSARSDRAVVFAILLGSLADDPDEALRYPLVADALRAGYFASPAIDPALLDALVEHPPRNSWDDDLIEVRILTAAEVAAHPEALGLG